MVPRLSEGEFSCSGSGRLLSLTRFCRSVGIWRKMQQLKLLQGEKEERIGFLFILSALLALGIAFL
jgi:hypothetical protein